MRFPSEWYQMLAVIDERFVELSEAQKSGLTLWVYGTILAKSACQNAVVTALMVLGKANSFRQYLREWLYDGSDRAAPCQTKLDIDRCFGGLVGWLISIWQGRDLALAIDPTAHGDRVVSLTVSVLYRGCAIPLVWRIVPANRKAKWIELIIGLLILLGKYVPKNMRVLVMADRGLWSPRLWQAIKELGWHPILRLRSDTILQPVGQGRQKAADLLGGRSRAWIGRGTAFRDANRRQNGTLVLVWDEGEKEPWVLLTNLASENVGIWWYSLRTWIELGFRVLKSVGWQWQHTRRTDPDRVARHWLVLAVATLWVMASGTRAEEAERRGVTPAQLHKSPTLTTAESSDRPRIISVFARGLSWLQRQFRNRRLWRNLWLLPDPWPRPPNGIQIIYHTSEPSTAPYLPL